MASSVLVRTRFLNTLTNEIKNGRSMVSCEKDKIDIEEYIIKVNRCIEKIETYCCKLETQTERLAEKVEDKEKEFIEHCIDENQALKALKIVVLILNFQRMAVKSKSENRAKPLG